MLIDVPTGNFERELQVINKAFNKAWEAEDPILGPLKLIPLRPDSIILAGNILQAAKDQNTWCNNTKVSVLRSILSIDKVLTENTWRWRGEADSQRVFEKSTRDGSGKSTGGVV